MTTAAAVSEEKTASIGSSMISASQFTAPLIGLSKVPPSSSLPEMSSVIRAARFARNPVMTSSGSNTATARTLKKSCIVAAVNAFRNSSV